LGEERDGGSKQIFQMKKIAILFILGFGLSSCEKYIDDAFLNPNAPTVAKPAKVLPAIIANMSRGIQFDSRMLGRYVQYWTLTGAGSTWDRMGYDPNSDNGGEKWRTHYWNLGLNVINMMNDARAEGKPEYVGAGNAIMAWSWLALTDYHNEVILKEAFNTSALTFKYDTQEEVYQTVATLCDSAITNFDRVGSVSEDFKVADNFMNKGDIQKWKKFTYAVKAKMLHRYALKSNYNPDEVIAAVNASLASADDDIFITFNNGPASSADANFYGPRRNNLASYRPTDLIIRYMDGNVFEGVNDPRKDYFFKPSADGVTRGVKTAAGEAAATPAARRTFNFFGFVSTAAPAGGVDTEARTYFKNDAPFPLITYSDMQFIKAEAAFRKGDRAMALDAYRKGIKGNFDMLKKYFTGYTDFTEQQATDYVNAVSPASATALTISDIMIQKYIALWGHGFEETWVDLRKFQYSPEVYKTFEPPTNLFPDNFNKLVYRVRPRYNSEYLWNVEELTRIGGLNQDYHTIEPWFVKN
jgi:hypothetical protein